MNVPTYIVCKILSYEVEARNPRQAAALVGEAILGVRRGEKRAAVLSIEEHSVTRKEA
jgi:hypothetical protein